MRSETEKRSSVRADKGASEGEGEDGMDHATSRDDAQRAPRAIRIVAQNFPSDSEPHRGTFVEDLALHWSELGIDVDVVAPLPMLRRESRRVRFADRIDLSGAIGVARPVYANLSTRGWASFSIAKTSLWNFRRAVARGSELLGKQKAPEVLFAFGGFPAGVAARDESRRRGIPLGLHLGEHDLDATLRGIDRSLASELGDAVGYVAAVSEANRLAAIERLGIDARAIDVVPNGVDTSAFQRRDRDTAREALGLPQAARLIGFVGGFSNRKGADRVLAALDGLGDDVFGVFLGAGPLITRGAKVLRAQAVAHSEIARWLNAFDVFCLPTRAEGASNALLEAMASECAIVTSRIPANEALCTDSEAVLVPPDDVDAIRSAIAGLLSDEARRRSLGAAARLRVRRWGTEDRARRIASALAGLVDARERAHV